MTVVHDRIWFLQGMRRWYLSRKMYSYAFTCTRMMREWRAAEKAREAK